MRAKGEIKKDFKKNASGEYCHEASKLKLEVLLDIRDLLVKRRRKLSEKQKKNLRKGLEKYWREKLAK